MDSRTLEILRIAKALHDDDALSDCYSPEAPLEAAILAWAEAGCPDAPSDDAEQRRQAETWMRTAVTDDADDLGLLDCGEVNRTRLAEECANELDLALDDDEATIPEWVFELAHEVADWWEDDDDDDDEIDDSNDCSSCGKDCAPNGECPKSRRKCGHHCNCSWTQDKCCWCGAEFGEDPVDGETPLLTDLEPGEVVPMTGEGR